MTGISDLRSEPAPSLLLIDGNSKETSMNPTLLGGLILAAAALLPQGKGVWTDPSDASLPPDFKIQGEYAGAGHGAQVIALGGGAFQAVIYPGGLPGDGWD